MTILWVLFWTIIGTAVGSFLNVVADRLPAGKSILSPPSACPHCQRRLPAWELVPVLSYFALRGRCRNCGMAIGRRTPAVEIVTGLLFALAAWQQPPSSVTGWLFLILASLYLAVFVTVTITDLEHGLIFNRIIVPAIGLAAAAAFFLGWPQVMQHLAAGGIGAGLIALIIYLVPGGMGWGDARLAGFIGLVTGLPGLWFALFVGFVSGGLTAAVLLFMGRVKRGDTLPLGPFLALGGTAVLLFGAELHQGFTNLAQTLF